jgi:membrane protease YdiL (CAAX protease family)
MATGHVIRRAATLWTRLPIFVRAVIVGSFVMSMATVPCGSLLRANFVLAPSVPWSFPLVAIYLWFYWHYLRGKGWPQTTAEFRRSNLRAHALSGRVWRWALLAGGLGWASVLGLRIVVDRLFEVPADSMASLLAYPLPMVLAYVIGVSVVAGVAEEAGCRGYMQAPIEQRHGPAVAILVVGIVFWLSHAVAFVGHWWLFLGRLWFYLAASIVFGSVAYLSRSILPGVVLHTAANLLGFGLVWWLEPRPTTLSVDGGQLDLLFWVTSLTTLGCIGAAVWAFRKLAGAS